MFGSQWRTNFEEKIFVGTDNYIKYSTVGTGGAGQWSFGMSSAGWAPASPANVTASLNYAAPNWTLTFQDGSRKIFDTTSGVMTATVDRNGNTTQLSYDASNRLTTVTDAAGRHLYFTYTGNVVTQVTSDFGTALSYNYDAQGRLSQVTRPDQTTISYTYDNNSMITSVTDGQGKVLESHAYDNKSRGLTSSRANGVESLSITY
jgi:YD repeat-containing protein